MNRAETTVQQVKDLTGAGCGAASCAWLSEKRRRRGAAATTAHSPPRPCRVTATASELSEEEASERTETDATYCVQDVQRDRVDHVLDDDAQHAVRRLLRASGDVQRRDRAAIGDREALNGGDLSRATPPLTSALLALSRPLSNTSTNLAELMLLSLQKFHQEIWAAKVFSSHLSLNSRRLKRGASY